MKIPSYPKRCSYLKCFLDVTMETIEWNWKDHFSNMYIVKLGIEVNIVILQYT